MSTEYVYGYEDHELERLGLQHQVWQDTYQALLKRAGFAPGDTVVDLGCGPGFTTLDLARVVGPAGRVIAIDRDGDRSLPLLERRAAAAGLENIETRCADLGQLQLPSESVDGVFGRWALMYLPEAAALALVERVARWLRPGGACALAEFCGFHRLYVHPPCAHLTAITNALMATVEDGRGCNPQIGNEIPGRLISAGLNVDIHVVTKAARPGTPEWEWPNALFREPLEGVVQAGHLDPEVREAFVVEWEQRGRDPGAVFISTPVMETIGRRAGLS